MEGIANFVGGLPIELKIAIAAVVLLAVRALLAGRVPDAFLTELATVIATFVIAVIELLLGLIPAQFDAIVALVLQLLVLLLGAVTAVRAYLLVRHSAQVRGFKL